MDNRRPDLSRLLEAARALRKKQTPAETVLWNLLRDRRFLGLKTRRQHRIGTFIADFSCSERRLVIEVDGGIHSLREQQLRDENRDACLKSGSWNVLRFTNEQILEEPEDVLDQIAAAVYSNESDGDSHGVPLKRSSRMPRSYLRRPSSSVESGRSNCLG